VRQESTIHTNTVSAVWRQIDGSDYTALDEAARLRKLGEALSGPPPVIDRAALDEATT